MEIAIIFDLIGVVLLQKNKAFSPRLIEIDNICGIAESDEEFVEIMRTRYNYSDDMIDKVLNEIVSKVIPNMEVFNLIDEIRLTHKYKIALMNNGILKTFNKWKEIYEFDKIFNVLYNSSQYTFRKPGVEAYETISALLKVGLDRCILIDDNETNLIGAQKCGMKTIAYVEGISIKNELEKLIESINS